MMIVTNYRISMFNFVVDDDILKPQISYISENPPLQYVSLCSMVCLRLYDCVCVLIECISTCGHPESFFPFVQNFLVVGKCIGQDTFECRKVYAENNRYVLT